MTRQAGLLSGVRRIHIRYTVHVRIRSVMRTCTGADTMDGYRMMLPSTATTRKPSPSSTMLPSRETLGTATITAVHGLWNLPETWAGVCFLLVPLCCIQLLGYFVVRVYGPFGCFVWIGPCVESLPSFMGFVGWLDQFLFGLFTCCFNK